MRSSTVRWGLALCLVGALAPAAAADSRDRSADAGTQLRTITIEVDYRNPPGTVDGAGCRAAPAPGCSLYVSGRTVFSGTIDAAGPWDAVVTPRPDGTMAFTGNNYLRGTIEGCGSGGFVYEDLDGTLERFEPTTQSFPAHNRWRIRADSATGDLAGRLVSGSGTQVWRQYPLNVDPAKENWSVGRITGTVVCRVPTRSAG